MALSLTVGPRITTLFANVMLLLVAAVYFTFGHKLAKTLGAMDKEAGARIVQSCFQISGLFAMMVLCNIGFVVTAIAPLPVQYFFLGSYHALFVLSSVVVAKYTKGTSTVEAAVSKRTPDNSNRCDGYLGRIKVQLSSVAPTHGLFTCGRR